MLVRVETKNLKINPLLLNATGTSLDAAKPFQHWFCLHGLDMTTVVTVFETDT